MADLADRQFDYEEPRLTERQKRLDAEDIYWCGREALIVTTHKYKAARAGLRRSPNALCLICLRPNKDHLTEDEFKAFPP
jgi:hypothetical protein